MVTPSPRESSSDDPRQVSRPELPDKLVDVVEQVSVWMRWIGPGRVVAAVGAALVVAGAGWWLLRSPATPTEANLQMADRAAAASLPTSSAPSPSVTTVSAVPETIVVHVTGAVRRPGIYELAVGQRVDDAIAAAGGPADDADPNALNLAAPVADGDRIAVPVAGEIPASPAESGHTRAGPTAEQGPGRIDVNSAEAAELETLPGIGPATAAAIVEHRSRHGPFASVDELEEVRGIGPAKLASIREHVRV